MPTQTINITRRVEIDAIGFNVGSDPAHMGDFEVRWRKLTYEGTAPEPAATGYHRTVLTPTTDIDALMEAVNVDLEAQGYGRMPADDIDLVKVMAKRYWTPEVRRAAAEAAAAEAAAP